MLPVLQDLYSLNYQIVKSGLGIARSYYVTTVGVNNKPLSKYTMMSINTTGKRFNLTDIISYTPQRLNLFAVSVSAAVSAAMFDMF